MQLTPLLLAASLALTTMAMPIAYGTAETASLTSYTKGGQRRCCPPFAPKNKHWPPPKLPCDPNCKPATLPEHDDPGSPAVRIIPAHEKEYKQRHPLSKTTEGMPRLPLVEGLRHGGVVHPDHDEQ